MCECTCNSQQSCKLILTEEYLMIWTRIFTIIHVGTALVTYMQSNFGQCVFACGL